MYLTILVGDDVDSIIRGRLIWGENEEISAVGGKDGGRQFKLFQGEVAVVDDAVLCVVLVYR